MHRLHDTLRPASAILAAAVLVAACTGSAATGTIPATASPEPTATPVASESAGPSATPVETPVPSGAPVNWSLIMGKAPLAAPAADRGAAAGARLNDFGLDMLRKMGADGNLVASPASIALVMAMVRAGASGSTATQMDAVLHGLGASGQSAEFVALLNQLKQQTIYLDPDGQPLEPGSTPNPKAPDPAAELRIANQVFSQKGMTLKQPFLDSLSSSFGAGVGQLDFRNQTESARLTINKWASDNTHGRIPEVLQPGDLSPDVVIALANAIYLRAPWQDPFDPAKTKPLPFTTAGGTVKQVPTMAAERMLEYGAGTGYRAVEIPLTYVTDMRMLVVVPDNMASFTASLSAAKLSTIRTSMTSYIVTLTLPRFSGESRFELSSLLRSLGMPDLFDPAKADLSGISSDTKIFIDKVIHQANIDVVEDGVTASAVTIALGLGAGMVEPPRTTFQINKPFLYFIQDRGSGAILFMGRVNDPTTK